MKEGAPASLPGHSVKSYKIITKSNKLNIAKYYKLITKYYCTSSVKCVSNLI